MKKFGLFCKVKYACIRSSACTSSKLLASLDVLYGLCKVERVLCVGIFGDCDMKFFWYLPLFAFGCFSLMSANVRAFTSTWYKCCNIIGYLNRASSKLRLLCIKCSVLWAASCLLQFG